MLLPTITVTAIGLLFAAVAAAVHRRAAAWVVLLGVVGAWIGYLIGAGTGRVLDAAADSDRMLDVFGHLGAIVVAAWAVDRFAAVGVGARTSR
ncbi:hypothetical protein JVX90_12860 [Gordonia sp. PDNC005]|uniref:hypothetical protein n=1 Tax=unclassified Gordonia (in: high G+C Gram-positive bacteria) TaxID=2657482 RepID=UPI001963C0C3|nr:hypothetical protein [Gordonia sp. PDNC005]QRY61312.1 hypothetical protein JVX90_12860 [Gordonia sp. PDNC005]